VRKTVDMSFFEKAFGQKWLESTVAALREKVVQVKHNGHTYWGYTPEAVDLFYGQVRNAGAIMERNVLHDRIVATLVFIFTNSEEDLSAALDASDDIH